MEVDTITGGAGVQQLAEEEGEVDRVVHVRPREHETHHRPDNHRCGDCHERDDCKYEQVYTVVCQAPGEQDKGCDDDGEGAGGCIKLYVPLFVIPLRVRKCERNNMLMVNAKSTK